MIATARAVLLLCACLAWGAAAQENNPVVSAVSGVKLSTGEISAKTMNVSCIDYQVVGVCIWLTCTPYTGCDVDYSVQVAHYNPDVTISSYADTGENPWSDVAALSQPNSLAQGGGSNTEGSTVINETALRFKNVDAIGNPAIEAISESLEETEYYCPSEATMMYPYYLSTIDPFWREPILETLLTLRYFFRYIGFGQSPLYTSTWGPLFPRIGFVHTGHDYKSGAVTAQRVANIITKEYQPHVYIPLVDDDVDPKDLVNQGYWPPGEAVEGDATTATWQQLLPRGNSQKCHVFADLDDQLAGPFDPFMLRLNEETGYIWNLWRPYSCCSQEGALLIAYNPAYENIGALDQ